MKTTRALLVAGVAACLFGVGIAGAADAKDTDTKAAEDPVTTKKSDAVTERAGKLGAERGLPKEAWMGTEPQRDYPDAEEEAKEKEEKKNGNGDSSRDK